jgi:hypothetical protein
MVFAYIDPGAGSLLIQALVAALVGVPILFHRQLARVIRLFRRGNGSDEPTDV